MLINEHLLDPMAYAYPRNWRHITPKQRWVLINTDAPASYDLTTEVAREAARRQLVSAGGVAGQRQPRASKVRDLNGPPVPLSRHDP